MSHLYIGSTSCLASSLGQPYVHFMYWVDHMSPLSMGLTLWSLRHTSKVCTFSFKSCSKWVAGRYKTKWPFWEQKDSGHHYLPWTGMSNPNNRYLKWNGNPRTARIPKIRTGLILLLYLGKIFRPIFSTHVFPMRITVR